MSSIKSLALCPVKISAEAQAEIINILNNKNISKEYGLRIGVNGGGCSGVTYFIGFDTKKEKDDIFNINGIQLFIEKKHSMFLWGVEVGFVETSEERGFIFNN